MSSGNNKGGKVIGIAVFIIIAVVFAAVRVGLRHAAKGIQNVDVSSLLSNNNYRSDSEPRRELLRTQASLLDTNEPDAASAHQNCLKFFDTINVLNCDLLDESVSEKAKISCRRYPTEILFDKENIPVYTSIIREWNYCDEGKTPIWKFSQFVNRGLEVINSLDDDQSLRKSIREAFTTDLATMDKELSKAVENIKAGRTVLYGMYPEDETPGVIYGLTIIYYYIKLCMVSPKNTCDGYDSVGNMEMLERVLKNMQHVFTHEFVKVDDPGVYENLSVGMMFSKPFVNAVAFYYKNHSFPADLKTLMNYSDYDCDDSKLVEMLQRAWEPLLDAPESIEKTKADCEKAVALPINEFDTRVLKDEAASLYSDYDIYSYEFLLNPQKYRYEVDGKVMRLVSNGLDALPDTDDDDVMQINADIFAK